MKKSALAEVRRAITQFRDTREEAKRLDAGAKKMQPEVIDLMRGIDPDNHGIVIDEEDKKQGTAFVQQNAGSEVWDEERIMTYLRKPGRKALWSACSSRVLDIQKWEAEVANGNIPKSIARKFRTTTTPPRPFVRFGKREDESL